MAGGSGLIHDEQQTVPVAIHAQVDELIHVCNGLGHLDPVTRLAEMIVAVFLAIFTLIVAGDYLARLWRQRKEEQRSKKYSKDQIPGIYLGK